MPIPVVALEWWGEAPEIYCPACGQRVVGDDDISPCEHLLFYYLPDIGAFAYLADHIADKLDKEDEEDLQASGHEALSAIAEAIDSPSAFCLKITTCGMTPDPTSATDFVGFDFRAERE